MLENVVVSIPEHAIADPCSKTPHHGPHDGMRKSFFRCPVILLNFGLF